jgi:hypothetical protein
MFVPLNYQPRPEALDQSDMIVTKTRAPLLFCSVPLYAKRNIVIWLYYPQKIEWRMEEMKHNQLSSR